MLKSYKPCMKMIYLNEADIFIWSIFYFDIKMNTTKKQAMCIQWWNNMSTLSLCDQISNSKEYIEIRNKQKALFSSDSHILSSALLLVCSSIRNYNFNETKYIVIFSLWISFNLEFLKPMSVSKILSQNVLEWL